MDFTPDYSEPLVHDADLLCEQLNLPVIIGELCIGMIQLGLQGKELILQRRYDNDKGYRCRQNYC